MAVCALCAMLIQVKLLMGLACHSRTYALPSAGASMQQHVPMEFGRGCHRLHAQLPNMIAHWRSLFPAFSHEFGLLWTMTVHV